MMRRDDIPVYCAAALWSLFVAILVAAILEAL